MHRAHSWIALAGALSATLVAAGAGAQDSRYGSWQPPGGAGDAAAMVRELRALVDEAERARAADPRFLRDLRDLADRHDHVAAAPAPAPLAATVLRDDFADGDYTRGTAWTVTAGSFRVEPDYGLVTDVGASTQPAAPAASGDGGSGKDLAAALITGLLSQYAQPKQQPQPSQAATDTVARIETRVPVANAFALELEVAAGADSRRIDFALFQGHEGGPTYVLAYSPGSGTPLELLRRTSRGSVVVGSYRQALPASQQTRRLSWRRDAGGAMSVSVDGRELLRATDTGLRDPFDGIAITNHGGLFAVREVSASSLR